MQGPCQLKWPFKGAPRGLRLSEMGRWALFLIGFVGSLGLYVAGAETPADDPFGQQNLRNEWHRLQGADLEVYSKFQRKSFLREIAEDEWIKSFDRDSKGSWKTWTASHDLPLSLFYWRALFVDSSLRADRWLSAMAHAFSNMWNYPVQGISFILHFIPVLFFPILLSLILVLSLYFWIWAPAILHDLPSWFPTRSRLFLFSLWAASLFWVVQFGWWIGFVHALLCVCIIYSRRAFPALALAILSAFLLASMPAFESLRDAADSAIALEALEKGRTRLEYSDESLNALPIVGKVLWSQLNSETQSAQYWYTQLLDSKEKSILQLHFELANGRPPLEVRRDYEKLFERFPGDPIIQFNLIQLLVQTQNLVRADELRSQLGNETYQTIARQTQQLGELPLAFPKLEDSQTMLMNGWASRIKNRIQTWNLHPFRFSSGLWSFFLWLLPWIVILLALSKRATASGVCIQTNEPTLRPSSEFAPLYLASTQNRDSTSTGSMNSRQQVDNLIRQHQRNQRNRLLLWRFFIFDSRALLQDQRWIMTWLKTSFLFALLWWAFPLFLRSRIMEAMLWDSYRIWSPTRFSIGLLISFMIVYILQIFWTKRGT